MAIYAAGVTQAYVNNNAQAKLAALRRALNDVHDFYLWLSAYAAADLVAIGFTSADAADIFSAITDANALYQIYTTGQPPASYPQAYAAGTTGTQQAYVYAAAQRVVIGPLS